MLHLVSLLTENYVPRARPFLESLLWLKRIEKSIIFLGSDVTTRVGLTHVQYYNMPRHWSESSCGIMQHGRWLDALPGVRDDDVYLLTDADIIVQRDMADSEWQLFESCAADEFMAGWNAGEKDNLHEEACRIDPLSEIEDIFGHSRTWGGIPCFNTGVLAMRGIAWKRLRDLYESRCERFYKLTAHRSRGQWLLNFCLNRLGLRASILPPTVHSHGHFSIPPGVEIRDGIALCHGETILFRHAL